MTKPTRSKVTRPTHQFDPNDFAHLAPPTPPHLLRRMEQTLEQCAQLRTHALVLAACGRRAEALRLVRQCGEWEREARGWVADWDDDWIERQGFG